MSRAIMPGSFNPFTIGHADILERALAIFDSVVVAVGFNCHKSSPEDIEPRLESIRNLYKDNPKVSVVAYSGLTVEVAKELEAVAIIRGIRDNKDFEYERNLADMNRRISGIDTIFLTAKPEYGYISSSAVRELEAFGYDTSEFLPS